MQNRQTSSENSPKMTFSNLQHSNSIKRLIYKRKTAVFIPAACIGDPNEIRTRVTAVRGRCPRPLDDGTVVLYSVCNLIFYFWQAFFLIFLYLSGLKTCAEYFLISICKTVKNHYSPKLHVVCFLSGLFTECISQPSDCFY